MTKTSTIRLLYAERCSLEEIRIGVGCSRQYVVACLGLIDYLRRRPGFSRGSRPGRAV